MINMITQEVYRQVREMQTTQDSKEEIFISDMRPNAKVEEMKRLFEAARRNNSFGVCIPQWFISVAKETLGDSKVNIATVVGLPEGTTSSLAKYAEIKQAVAQGADIVMVPINMDYCIAGDMANMKKDLAESLTAVKGKVTSAAIVEVKDLDPHRILETAEACASAGAKVIMLSAVTGGNVKPEVVRKVREKGMSVGVFGGASDSVKRREYKQAGASWITVRYR